MDITKNSDMVDASSQIFQPAKILRGCIISALCYEYHVRHP